MGKRKRPSNQALSQEEIWDDSALIRSWDEAVAEYEFYHSIAARGEDVEEVLRLAELEEESGAVTNCTNGVKVATESGGMPINGTHEAPDGELEEGEVDEDGNANLDQSKEASSGANRKGIIAPQSQQAKSAGVSTENQAGGKVSKAPASEMGSSAETAETAAPGHDQILENIKMAYWWAGYYSGLYEGQQQAQRASPRRPKSRDKQSHP